MTRPCLVLAAMFALGGCGQATGGPPSDASAERPSHTAGQVVPASNLAEARPALTGSRSLVLEFPDGVRGGHGRIRGKAQWGGDHSIEALLDLLRQCHAVEPRHVEAWSHRFHIVSRSTARDREVVRCLRERTWRHFNAGIGSNDPGELIWTDWSPFREFEAPAAEEH